MELDPKYDDYDFPTTAPVKQNGHPGHLTEAQQAQVHQLRMLLESEGYTKRLDTLTLVSHSPKLPAKPPLPYPKLTYSLLLGLPLLSIRPSASCFELKPGARRSLFIIFRVADSREMIAPIFARPQVRRQPFQADVS